MRTLAYLLLLLVPVLHAQAPADVSCGQRMVSLDTGWRFHLGDVAAAETPSLGDATWQTVAVPHDWAVLQPFAKENASGGAGAFAPAGVAWYRLHLPAAPSPSCGDHSVVQFDGVMANADVWINGHLLGHHPNGYVSFRYDLTQFLNAGPGTINLLAVRTDTSAQPSSRYYQGAGIYRHVHLFRLPAMHITGWSTVVRTPTVTPERAEVEVETGLHNEAHVAMPARVRIHILDSTERVVAHADVEEAAPTPVGGAPVLRARLALPKPQLWDLDHPTLYRARIELLDGQHVVQTEEVRFGVREMHFSPATGFWLNGRNLKIKGVALHSDVGALGMAAPLSVWRHRLLAMQRMGANAIRTAHNPVGPEFLDLCDDMGMLVLDEAFDQWSLAKVPYDYHLFFNDWSPKDLAATVRRDRNHPSIFAWSAGNEIRDTMQPALAKKELAALLEVYHREDPTRPVTQALFRPNASHDYEDGLADMLDVVGQNYRPNEILAAYAQEPTRRILGTENIHDRATWLAVRDHPEYSGMFLWAGTDYLGESRKWPLFADSEGMMDRTDFDKPDSLERESWWAAHPVVHVVRRIAPVPRAPTDPGYELDQYRPRQTAFHDWTPVDRSYHPEQVEVYSNCARVQLLLNGSDLGSKDRLTDASAMTWIVPFAPGVLEARCTDRPGVKEILRTAGAPTALRLAQESPIGIGFDDVSLVRATVLDAKGTPVPGASMRITFSSEGASILATDNADTIYSEPFPSVARTTLDGRAVVYLRAKAGSGLRRVRATVLGMKPTVLLLR